MFVKPKCIIRIVLLMPNLVDLISEIIDYKGQLWLQRLGLARPEK